METGCLLHCLEVEETNVFEAVKQSVTTRQAALVYGISVGRNGMARCPFHDDRHPSMKVDRRFHCFACQADGDVIDFTSRLFGLSSKEAALKLAEDFSISFDRKGHDPPQKRVIKRKSARKCDTGRQSRNAFGCCATTCVCWNDGKKNMRPNNRRMTGILCLWRLCTGSHISNICWIFFCLTA